MENEPGSIETIREPIGCICASEKLLLYIETISLLFVLRLAKMLHGMK